MFPILVTILFNAAFITILMNFGFTDSWVHTAVLCICSVGILFEMLLLIAFCASFKGVAITIWYCYSIGEVVAAIVILLYTPMSSKLVYLEFFVSYAVLKFFRVLAPCMYCTGGKFGIGKSMSNCEEINGGL